MINRLKVIGLTKPPKFALGQTVITINARHELTDFDITYAMNRFIDGDWGLCCEEDKQANDEGLSTVNPDRLLAVYETANGTPFWIITEYDRSVTTVLMPSDY